MSYASIIHFVLYIHVDAYIVQMITQNLISSASKQRTMFTHQVVQLYIVLQTSCCVAIINRVVKIAGTV